MAPRSRQAQASGSLERSHETRRPRRPPDARLPGALMFPVLVDPVARTVAPVVPRRPWLAARAAALAMPLALPLLFLLTARSAAQGPIEAGAGEPAPGALIEPEPAAAPPTQPSTQPPAPPTRPLSQPPALPATPDPSPAPPVTGGASPEGADSSLVAAADSSVAPCFDPATPWHPEESLLSNPVTAVGIFGILVDASLKQWLVSTAAAGVQRVLGFDEVAMERGEILFREEGSDRVVVLRTTGLGRSAEDGVQADYPLWGPLHLRSEVRERGEASFELRREIQFW